MTICLHIYSEINNAMKNFKHQNHFLSALDAQRIKFHGPKNIFSNSFIALWSAYEKRKYFIHIPYTKNHKNYFIGTQSSVRYGENVFHIIWQFILNWTVKMFKYFIYDVGRLPTILSAIKNYQSEKTRKKAFQFFHTCFVKICQTKEVEKLKLFQDAAYPGLLALAVAI